MDSMFTLKELNVKPGDTVWFCGFDGDTNQREMTVCPRSNGRVVAGKEGWFDHVKAFRLLPQAIEKKGFAKWISDVG